MNSVGNFLAELTGPTNLHPMIIHFPIVLLFVFLVLYIISSFTSVLISQWINFALIIVLIFFCFVSKYTGENAGIEVGPTLVNPRALTNHASNALDFIWSIVGLGIIFALVEFIIIRKKIVARTYFLFFRSSILAIGLVSILLLLKTGHTGANLVYQYAAGVDIPLKRAEKVIEQHEKNK